MELTLQSLSPRCHVSGRDFVEGDRVVSFLVRGAVPEGLTGKEAAVAAEAITRADVLESELAGFTTNGTVACRWAQVFKVRKAADNPERNLKLTAESLFLALGDPANERTVENERLLQVLAIMLERKRVLRPKGRSGGGANAKQIYEHAKLKTLHEVQAADLSPEFFLSIQEQLAALVGRGGGAGAGATAEGAAGEGEARPVS
jgi:hypothetical protein